VTVNAVHPGCVRTEVTRHMPLVMRVANIAIFPVLLLIQKTPKQGSVCTLDAVCNPVWSSVSGKYLFHCQEVSCGEAAEKMEDAQALWELSEKVTGISSAFPPRS